MKKTIKYCGMSRSERGVNLVEIAIALAVISLTIVVWLRAINVSTKGTQISKNNLRAQNLAMSKLEDYKNMAINSSLAGTWNGVTATPLALAYGVTQTAILADKAFTWQVRGSWVTVESTSYTASANVTNMLTITAMVTWDDITGPKRITLTGSAADFR